MSNPGDEARTADPAASATDCEWPDCKGPDGECKLGYPCTKQNSRVSRRITALSGRASAA